MANRSTQVTWTGQRGRIGRKNPLEIPDGGLLDAVNVDTWQCGLARKRGPLVAVSLTSGPTTTIWELFTHVPASSDAAAELWAIEAGAAPGTNNVKRLAAGTWSAPAEETAADSDFTNFPLATARALNGKLFLTGANTVKVWDGSVIRQVGISPVAAPTVTDTGAGTYAAVLRYYKVAFVQQVTGTTTRRAELSPAVSFTPSGGGTAARVARPTVPLGAPTHWEVYGSANGTTYYLLATVANATANYDDSAVPSAYSGNQPPVVGENTCPTNWKAIAKDGNRLLGWGCYTAGEKQSRVWYTAVLGESYIGDEERVPSDHYKDVGESDGDFATAISDNINGAIYLFKRRHIYKMVPTGDALDPYVIRNVSNCVGARLQTSVIEGEDAQGMPCLYFRSDYRLYRLGLGGLEVISDNIIDLAPNALSLQPLLYYPARKQVWVQDAANACTLIYQVDTGAWTRFTGAFASATCAALYAVTLGSTEFIPYVAYIPVATPLLGYYNGAATTGMTDPGSVAYGAYVDVAPRAPFGTMSHVETQDPMLVVQKGTCAALRVTAYSDFVTTSLYFDVTCVTSSAAIEYALVQAENVRAGGGTVIHYRIGEATGNTDGWAVNSIAVNALQKEGL